MYHQYGKYQETYLFVVVSRTTDTELAQNKIKNCLFLYFASNKIGSSYLQHETLKINHSKFVAVHSN